LFSQFIFFRKRIYSSLRCRHLKGISFYLAAVQLTFSAVVSFLYGDERVGWLVAGEFHLPFQMNRASLSLPAVIRLVSERDRVPISIDPTVINLFINKRVYKKRGVHFSVTVRWQPVCV
jgi:hypothetical protein